MSRIHHTAVIGDGVEIGTDVSIGPHAVILGPAWIGDECWIGPGAVIGTPPEITSARQNLAWRGELAHHGVRIGARVVIRELSTIHQGSWRPTQIGSDTRVFNRVYVAHDCQIGDDVTLSAGTSLGGHVMVGDRATVGMNVTVHQRRVIGPGAMVGMGAAVTRDVPPFAKAYGCPVRLRGANTVMLTRMGIAEAATRGVRDAYANSQEPDRADLPEALVGAFDWWTMAAPAQPLVAAHRVTSATS